MISVLGSHNDLRKWLLSKLLGSAPHSASVLLVLILSSGPMQAQDSTPAKPAAKSEPGFKTKSALATAFFRSNYVPTLKIEVSSKNLQRLREDPRAYVPARVIEDGTVYEDVGVHLKGAAGSFRQIDDRPALTLNFDKFKEGQHFHGLDKLHLNNSVQDPSYTTEWLCGELFLAAGIPATRATHVVVELNQRNLGLYVLKEGFDKTFLKRNGLNPTGNLYDSGFLRDITEPLDLITGDPKKGRGDLESLVVACQLQDSTKRFEALERSLDMDRFLTFLAMEIVTWHWDGYYLKHNNYRVYSDPDTKKLVFLPHGMDQMFWSPNGPFMPAAEGMVAQALLSTPAGKARYKARITQIATNLLSPETLTAQIKSVQSKIRPVIAKLDGGAAKEHDATTRKLIRAVTQRAEFLVQTLAAEELKPMVFASTNEIMLEPKSWQKQIDSGEANFSRKRIDNIDCLEIEIQSSEEDLNCLASYRSRVMLNPGRYQFKGRMKTEGVEMPGKSVRGAGAGFRVSMARRTNAIVGTQDWQDISFEFDIREPAQTKQLICDLRAKTGRVWFDVNSLKLARLGEAGPEVPPAEKREVKPKAE